MSTTARTAIRAIRPASTDLRRTLTACALLLANCISVPAIVAQEPELRTMFRVKYVAEGVVYLDGGNNAGLAEGMKLVIKRSAVVSTETGNGEVKANLQIAEISVSSVAGTSAVCDVVKKNREIEAGDVAYLPQDQIEALVQKRALSGTRHYPMVISFSEGDPMDEDVRAAVPRPPSPEVNRARGRIGLDYSGTSLRGSGASSQTGHVGLVVRTDVTRIAGTYWNLSGYWRGRLDSRSQPGAEGIQDLVNRTYHLSLTYTNPTSRWIAGVGRLNIPWASSLETIDGGYFGRRIGTHVTTGIFAGSTPDPTAWNYDPERQIAGSFVNVEQGSFDSLRYSGTFGMGVNGLRWHIDRPFAFVENGVFYKQFFSVYHSMQADSPRNPQVADAGAGVSRSYLTIRVQPRNGLAFDVNHNYFRDVPTYDPRLISTGLVDKLLFQGLSAGVRVDLPEHVTLYTNIGRSTKSGDARSSLNGMFGVTLGKIWKIGVRADFRYSQFDSAFGSGDYRSISFSRNMGDRLHWEIQTGTQAFRSPLTADDGSTFVNTTLDLSLGLRYFIEGGYTIHRGHTQNIDQWFSTFGYRFDSKAAKR